MADVYDQEPNTNQPQSGSTQGKKAAGQNPAAKIPGIKGKEEAAAKGQAKASAEGAEAERLRPLFRFRQEDFKDKRFGKLRLKFASRKRTTIGITSVGIIGAGFYAFSGYQGTFEAIHYAKLLEQFHSGENQETSDGRAARFMRGLRVYAATGAIGAARNRTRLGVVGNKFADRWEGRFQRESGLVSVHDPATGRLSGFASINDQKSIGYLAEQDFKNGTDLDILDRPPPGSIAFDADGNIFRPEGSFLDVRHMSTRARRKFARIVTQGTHTRKVSSWLASRTLIKRYGLNFHPRKALKQAIESRIERHNKRKQDKADAIKEGTEPPDAGRLSGEDSDEDGTPDRNNDVADSGNDIIDDAVDADTPQAKRSLVSRLIKGGGVVLAIVGALCIVRDFDDQIQEYQFQNINILLARMGGDRVTNGNQSMTDVDNTIAEQEVETDLLFDNITNMGWSASKVVQAELGQAQTGPDVPEDAKPGSADETPWLFRTVGGMGFLGPICGAQDALEGVPIIGDAIRLSDGAMQSAIDAALSLANTDMQTLMTGVVSFFSNTAVDVNWEGPLRGGAEVIGWFLAMDDQAISMGGTAMSPVESAVLKTEVRESQQLDQQNKPYFARMFDVYDPNSMVGTMMRETPNSPMQAIATLFNAPLKLLSTIFTPVSAQDAQPYDYGVPKYGFTSQEQNDPRVDDPFENARIVEEGDGIPDLDALNAEWGDKCFGMRIDNSTDRNGLIFNRGTNPAEIPDECRTDANNDGIEDDEGLLRYRFYIADTITELSLACYEGDEEACNMLTYGSQQAADLPATGSVGVSPDGFTFPLAITKDTLINQTPEHWCYDSQSHCHHDYPAADIFAPTGTDVLAARGGTVISASDNDDSSVGSRVTIKGEDGNIYYYAHMGEGTIEVNDGEEVSAGDRLGQVGTREDAMNKQTHLHFDILPGSYDERPTCSATACTAFGFTNPQSVLMSAYNGLR